MAGPRAIGGDEIGETLYRTGTDRSLVVDTIADSDRIAFPQAQRLFEPHVLHCLRAHELHGASLAITARD